MSYLKRNLNRWKLWLPFLTLQITQIIIVFFIAVFISVIACTLQPQSTTTTATPTNPSTLNTPIPPPLPSPSPTTTIKPPGFPLPPPYENLKPPPWPNVSYYYDASKTITDTVGEEFTIGFNTFARGGAFWKEMHDEKMISLVVERVVPPGSSPVTTWFLFKALQAGKTQITFKYYRVDGQLSD